MSVRTSDPRRPPANGRGLVDDRGRPSRDRLALEARRAARPLTIYLLALAGALAVTGVILRNINVSLPWSHPYEIRVAVDDAKGVVSGTDPVRIAGVPVGRITAVNLVAGRPVLTATIDRKYAPLYQDARFQLRPQTALDDMYLDVVDRGHPSAGRLGPHEILPADRAQSPVDIGKVLDVFNADVRTQMKRALDELSVGLPRHGADLRMAVAELAPFLQSTQRLTSELATRRGYTARLVHNLRLLTEELGARTGSLVSLVRSGSTTFQTVSHNAAPLASLIEELPPALTQLQGTFTTLRGTLDVVDPALDSLRPVTRTLAPGMRALESFSQTARPALQALDAPVKQLAPLARALAPTSSSLAAAFAGLEPQAPRLDRVTAAIVPCESAVQGFFQWTPSVFKFSDPQGAYPRGESVYVNDAQLAKAPSCADSRSGK